MSDVYETILEQKEITKYKQEDVPKEDLDKILKCMLHIPEPVNGQQFSVIVVKDKNVKKEFAKMAGDLKCIEEAPVFLVFVADFSRVAKTLMEDSKSVEPVASIESVLVGAVDCGMASGIMMLISEAMGYGIYPVRAIRKEPEKVIKLLKLPKYVYPIIGMCLGKTDNEKDTKPRFKINTLIHQEEYKPATDDEIKEYDNAVMQYLKNKNPTTDTKSLADVITKIYSEASYKKVYSTIESQGFKDR